jgi:hypothetical protein
MFCHFEPINQVRDNTIPMPTEFTAFLVYDGKKYIGYLNEWGNFRPISESTPEKIEAIDQRQQLTFVVLFWLQWVCLLFSVVIGIWILWLGQIKVGNQLNSTANHCTRGAKEN